jgi:hypothetical protein
MTTIPALYQITTGTLAEFETRNAVYPLGVPTYIISGAKAGRMKIGDGATHWNSLPFFPPQATEAVLGLIKSSTTHLFARVNADGTVTVNGLEVELTAIYDKNAEQDGELAAVNQKLQGMSVTIIYIGEIGEYTSGLTAMSAADRDSALTARAVEIRGQVMDGYTLQDLGMADEPGRFHYWQHQPDGTWFDLGERGEVSQATDTDLGIVMGSGAEYRVHIELDGTMSVNGLSAKLAALDAKDGEQEAAIAAVGGALDAFKTEQGRVNNGAAKEIEDIKEAAETLSGNFDGFKTAQEANNLEQQTAITEAKANADSRAEKDFAKATHNYVVGDFTYTPADNKTVHLKKTAVSVDGAGTTQVYEGDLKLGTNLKLEQKTAEEFELNIDDEISARNKAISAAVETTLADEAASDALPATTPFTFADLLQNTRNNLKWLKANSGGGGGETAEIQPPFFTDRDGFFVAARGGTLIELNVTEPWEVFLPLLVDREKYFVAGRGGTRIEVHRTEPLPAP